MAGAGNSATSFGWVSRWLHWVTAVLVLTLLALGSYIARMEVSLANLWLFGLHKTIGFVVLTLLVLRVAWHRRTPPPQPLDDGVRWHARLATTVHRLFYLLLLLVPVTGWIGSAASGLDVVVFGRWTLPRIAPASETLETAAFAVHGALTKLLFVLVVLHVAGALRRRDGTLRRMLVGTASDARRQ